MARYKINTPEKGYTGLVAGVSFFNGEGFTEDEWAINWFRGKGYGVELVEESKKSKK